MKYQEIYDYVKKSVTKKNFSKIADKALSIYVNDENNSGEFYIAIKAGKVEVENFKYDDYTAHITTSSATLKKAIDGTCSLANKIDDGDANAVADVLDIIAPKKVAEKKAAAKKPAAKKATTTKTATAKKAAAKKVEAPKAEAKKVEAPKTEVKTEAKAPAKKAATTKKAATKKVEAPKAEAKKVEAPKTEVKTEVKAPAKKAATTKKAAAKKATK